ncbi:nectin-3-like protein isoform X2 [Pygocentrus nattereri]|uniref:nectin-3-like protein isoform X2 n=1 Tax=Pygocentrus nattereri TaxID=42514 RepID=UPI00081485F8|nr:nectin-3-like protein isoform X2 [Pygocentrus nattereri]
MCVFLSCNYRVGRGAGTGTASIAICLRYTSRGLPLVPNCLSCRTPTTCLCRPLNLSLAKLLKRVCSNEVLVPENIRAVLGKNVTLSCRVEVGANLSLTQSSWERRLPTGMATLAVFNPQFGTSIAEEYRNRIHFVRPSVEDASIVLQGVGFEDIGSYTCKVVTFPLGNTQASTVMDVLVEPKVYMSASSSPLVDGDVDSVVATCTAERARPPAEILWVSDLSGRSEEIVQVEPDGATTTHVHYIWSPSSRALGHTLTCVVRHPALDMEFRAPYVLNVQFAPDVMVVGQDEVWYVGQENARLDCRANANPLPHLFLWTRVDMQMPAGVQTANGSLVFTRPLQRNDSGTYRCEVQNDVGLRSQDVQIRIREPPPTTSVPTTTTSEAVVLGSSSTSATQRHAHFTSPTLASVADGTVGTVVGGAVGGVLLLALLLGLGALCYMRQRRTFRGDYYTKQYMGPSDMQKESQLDVLQPHELHNVFGDDSGKGSQDLKPKPEGDVIYPDYTKDEGSWDDSLQRSCSYYSDHHAHHNVNPSGPPVHGPTLNNGTPYLQDSCFDNGTDCDYVSHTDGSVISRREWYV